MPQDLGQFFVGIDFNFMPSTPGTTGIKTVDGGYWEKQYMQGGIKAYAFSVAMFRPVSFMSGTEQENIYEMQFVQDAIMWVEEQNNKGNFPDYGEDNEIIKIEALSNMGNITGADENGAEYRFPVKITYLTKLNY